MQLRHECTQSTFCQVIPCLYMQPWLNSGKSRRSCEFDCNGRILVQILPFGIYLLILNQMHFYLVLSRKENCYHDYIQFNLKGNGIVVLSVRSHEFDCNGRILVQILPWHIKTLIWVCVFYQA